ncbi:MAG: DUF1343 domain-containing protein [Candidatus Marinimicrobia bacterium]|nr:DUF1343 domain-containing protein [Candidatus Neomarinimicrobiota bacterium]
MIGGTLLLSIGAVSLTFGEVPYRSGLDVIASDGFLELQGKTVGVVVNHTSLNSKKVHLIKLTHEAGINIAAVFTPEHGFKGIAAAGEKVEDGKEPLSGAPIFSLYGKNRKPSEEMLAGIDVLVFDLQDIGVRYYTYLSTLTLVMEAAAEQKIPLIVLDRVNPLLHTVQGPVLDSEYASFVGMHPIPVLHGMSLGELAMMINGEGWLKNELHAELTVIPYNGKVDKKVLKNAFDPTPSPNMPNLETAWLYQGLCLLEGTNISEGRGTDSPFMLIGAPWLDADLVLEKLESTRHPQDVIAITQFTPEILPHAKYPKYAGEECYGFKIGYLKEPLKWTVHFLAAVHTLHPQQFRFLESQFIDKLYGSDRLRLSIKEGTVNQYLVEDEAFLSHFITLRNTYQIY